MMMINNIGKPGFQRILVYVFAALVASVFHIDLALATPQPLDKVVAVINNDVIMKSELEFRLRQVKEQLHNKKLELPPEAILEKQVLERMIDENLQIQEAKKQGVHISDEELGHEMEQVAKKNHMSLVQFRESLKSKGIEYSAVRGQIRKEIMMMRAQQLDVLKNINITQQEVDNYINSPEAKKHFVYHLSHILVAIPENASSGDIKRADSKARKIHVDLMKNPDNFGNIAIRQSQGQFALNGGDLGWRSVDELPDSFVRIAETLKPGEISSPFKDPGGFHILKLAGIKGAEKHFETLYHVRHILVRPDEIRSNEKTHQLALEIYKKLLNKEDSFSHLAKTYSDDKNSALDGGNLGWITLDRLVPEFADKIKHLSIKSYSKPFKSEYGWHIAEVMGKRKEDVSKKKQRERVREMLVRRKFEEELPIWIRQLKNNAYIKEML